MAHLDNYRSDVKYSAGHYLKEKVGGKGDKYKKKKINTAVHSHSVLVFYFCVTNYHKPTA